MGKIIFQLCTSALRHELCIWDFALDEWALSHKDCCELGLRTFPKNENEKAKPQLPYVRKCEEGEKWDLRFPASSTGFCHWFCSQILLLQTLAALAQTWDVDRALLYYRGRSPGVLSWHWVAASLGTGRQCSDGCAVTDPFMSAAPAALYKGSHKWTWLFTFMGFFGYCS